MLQVEVTGIEEEEEEEEEGEDYLSRIECHWTEFRNSNFPSFSTSISALSRRPGHYGLCVSFVTAPY
jgi:hypothetical protein